VNRAVAVGTVIHPLRIGARLDPFVLGIVFGGQTDERELQQRLGKRRGGDGVAILPGGDAAGLGRR